MKELNFLDILPTMGSLTDEWAALETNNYFFGSILFVFIFNNILTMSKILHRLL
ncbi:hypothetical protein GCM10007852_33360 [Agaribacter marinus]|uniref:Uncharacterized protein n=1 Tax=Agaribacter marinus TaxID=1431249 RepID=A0AA37T5E9_9ALTE|nr:hypothetical protein GCM10007852_33360 [Agaribacter marinus]